MASSLDIPSQPMGEGGEGGQILVEGPGEKRKCETAFWGVGKWTGRDVQCDLGRTNGLLSLVVRN